MPAVGTPFGADPVTEMNVDGRVASGLRNITQVFECGASHVLIAMSGSVFTAEPAKYIPIVEVEGKQGLAKELGVLVQPKGCVVRMVTGKTKQVKWCPWQLDAQDGVRFNRWASERQLVAVVAHQPRPHEMPKQ
jgi:hypothetical protein